MKQVQKAGVMGTMGFFVFAAEAGGQWAANIFWFVTVLELAQAVAAACSRKASAIVLATYQRGEHLPGWVDAAYYVALVLGLVAAGWWFSGIAWFVVGVLDAGHRARAEESAILERRAFCIHCQESFSYFVGNEQSRQNAYQAMKAHELECELGPFLGGVK